MDEITFVDVLTHYQMKLQEVSDAVNDLKSRLRKVAAESEAAWRSPAADTFLLKLNAVDAELAKTLSEISEAFVKLTAIGDDLAADVTTVI